MNHVKVKALTMGGKSLQEVIVPTKWYNPFPPVRYTERPDVVAAHLMEGNIAIIVDTSPSVILLPVTMLSFFEKAEDYNQQPILAFFYKIEFMLYLLLVLFLTPALSMAIRYFDSLPSFLHPIVEGVKDLSVFDALGQMLIMELGLVV